jgi:hypothetical protein
MPPITLPRLAPWALVRAVWHPREVTDPARELADLRAWLTSALRMSRREPGPAGLTLLGVPSDRELIDEIRRLRELADRADTADDHPAP